LSRSAHDEVKAIGEPAASMVVAFCVLEPTQYRATTVEWIAPRCKPPLPALYGKTRGLRNALTPWTRERFGVSNLHGGDDAVRR